MDSVIIIFACAAGCATGYAIGYMLAEKYNKIIRKTLKVIPEVAFGNHKTNTPEYCVIGSSIFKFDENDNNISKHLKNYTQIYNQKISERLIHSVMHKMENKSLKSLTEEIVSSLKSNRIQFFNVDGFASEYASTQSVETKYIENTKNYIVSLVSMGNSFVFDFLSDPDLKDHNIRGCFLFYNNSKYLIIYIRSVVRDKEIKEISCGHCCFETTADIS
jgi:hypothetical protein